jgi:hypothetical protein
VADRPVDGALRRGVGGTPVTEPTFFVVGAGRSGTTTLHHVLAQHPDVFVSSRKSPNHFAAHLSQPEWETPAARAMARQWVADDAAYLSLFDGATTERAIGDVSPVYLQALDVPRRIHAAHPDARILAILRDPVDRALAHFVGRQRDGIETCADFEDRVALELSAPLPDEVAFGHVLGCGRYHHFLSPYLELFGADRVKVVLYDDLVNDARSLMTEIFTFLDVDAGFVPDLGVRLNRTGIIRNRPARAVWTRTVRIRTALRPVLPEQLRRSVGRRFLTDLDKPAIDPDLRRRLVEVFRDDVVALEGMIDRDLSHWLST